MNGIKIISIIMIITVIIRFYDLGGTPSSIDWDEAALGYNAYSILKTGKDEYGIPYPLALRSFDDYKPPLYMYLTIPSVMLFGMTPWSVRLPSAVFGTSAVLGTYLLARELFRLRNSKGKDLSIPIAGIAAFLLAISPWHIQFSRIAFEANIGLTLNVWGLYLFFRGRTNPKLWIASAALLSLALYAYHSERIFVPVMILFLSVVFRRIVMQHARMFVASVFVMALIASPLIPVMLGKDATMRLKGTSAFSDSTRLLSRTVVKLSDDLARGDVIGSVLDNRRTEYLKTVANGYLSHFSPRWLFLTGDNDRHHAPDMGLLYFVELPFLIIGMVFIWKTGGWLRTVLFGWVLISPVAASVTSEVPHAIRTLVVLPVLQIFTAVGVTQVIIFLSKVGMRVRIPVVILVFAGFAFNLAYYFHSYFVHQNRETARFWQYGYEQAVRYAESEKPKYKKIVVSTKLEQPHMFFLFFTRYDPLKYQSEGGTSSGGFAEVKNRFDGYEFRPIHWEQESKDGSILYIGTPEEIRWGHERTILYPDGTDAIRIAH